MQLAVPLHWVDESKPIPPDLTKLGGSATLPMALTPEEKDLFLSLTECGVCRKPLYLFAQCSCPLVIQGEETDHIRMLYVFCCNTSSCAAQPSKSWRCVSIQSKCALQDDANAVDPTVRPLSEAPPPQSALPLRSFPSIELDVEDEPPAADENDAALSSDPAVACAANPDISPEELEELDRNVDLKNKTTDLYFEKFRAAMSLCPRQVLRYQRHGIPIFMNPDKTIYVNIPPCGNCGGPQAMELQVMPTAVYFLKVERYVDPDVQAAVAPAIDDGVDFGTVSVYTCLRGCLAERNTVVQGEFVFVEPQPTFADEDAQGKETMRGLFAA